ncbi:MAG: hypothetical protein MN733_21300 [Nitrososphaera sp.]|nr:hypothetical protein [Nitrososphaera sp.]
MTQFTNADKHLEPFSEQELSELRRQGKIGLFSGLLVSLPLLAFYVAVGYGIWKHFVG